MNRQPVIIVTDGDETAYGAVKAACEELQLQVMRQSQGNPTPISGDEIVQTAQSKGRGQPIVIMVDDQGDANLGKGERALAKILASPRLSVLGVVAVAAHTRGVKGVVANVSVTSDASMTVGAVNKEGEPAGTVLHGDTVDILRDYPQIPIVGLGDPGKMQGHDKRDEGAPATTRAIAEVLERSGFHAS